MLRALFSTFYRQERHFVRGVQACHMNKHTPVIPVAWSRAHDSSSRGKEEIIRVHEIATELFGSKKIWKQSDRRQQHVKLCPWKANDLISINDQLLARGKDNPIGMADCARSAIGACLCAWQMTSRSALWYDRGSETASRWGAYVIVWGGWLAPLLAIEFSLDIDVCFEGGTVLAENHSLSSRLWYRGDHIVLKMVPQRRLGSNNGISWNCSP